MPQNNTRLYLKYFSILTALFILYNTLIPFKIYLELWKIERNINLIEWMPYIHDNELVSLTDILGNFLLFMPLGFFVYLYFRLQNQNKLIIIPTVLLGMLLSIAIEFAQIFFRYRITSMHDIINNTLGTLGGAVTGRIYYNHFKTRTEQFFRAILHNEPLTLLILLIIAGGLFSSLLPFNISLTISDLKYSLKNTNIMPLGNLTVGQWMGLQQQYPPEQKFTIIRFLGDVLFYTIYGYLAGYIYFKYWRGNSFAIVKFILITFVLLPFFEIIQFIIRSRFSDINDVISGYLGIAVGLFFFMALKRDIWFKNVHQISLKQFYFPLSVYFIYLLYSNFLPFDFSLNSTTLSNDLQIRNLVPFYYYFKSTSLWNIYDMMEAAFKAVPLGIMFVHRKITHPAQKNWLLNLAFFAFFLALLLEGGQIFLASRTGEITDVIFFLIGALTGGKSYAYYRNRYAYHAFADNDLQPSMF
ncbi:MAG: hypothetical protein GF313_05375 [Caldithrix sp.]|nr:hypothetical protein [Caldithrix sp.]